MKILSIIKSSVAKIDVPAMLPYFTALYYIEILYMMFTILMLYGKFAAILAGFPLALLLSAHIVLLYFKKSRSRIIQLFIMDLHAAYSIAFIASAIAGGNRMSIALGFILAVRITTALFEIPLVFALTSEKVKEKYN